MNYPSLLKTLRDRSFMTQNELAVKLNVSFVTVNRWENGKAVPSIKAKKRIASLCTEYGVKYE